jgi:hypothetical protein
MPEVPLEKVSSCTPLQLLFCFSEKLRKTILNKSTVFITQFAIQRIVSSSVGGMHYYLLLESNSFIAG